MLLFNLILQCSFPLFTVQDDAVNKVYDIFSSDTVETEVRITAAQQLAIMMEGV